MNSYETYNAFDRVDKVEAFDLWVLALQHVCRDISLHLHTPAVTVNSQATLNVLTGTITVNLTEGTITSQ